MNKRLLFSSVAAILVVSSAQAATVDITFTEAEFTSNLQQATNEYAAYGFQMSNSYFYVDSRDPFDRQGISTNSGQLGRVDFDNDTSFFDFQWWSISQWLPATFTAYDSSNSVVDTVVVNSGTSGTASLSGAISYVTFSGNSFGVMSGFKFDDGSGVSEVPLPATLPMLASVLGFGAFMARRKKRQA